MVEEGVTIFETEQFFSPDIQSFFGMKILIRKHFLLLSFGWS